MKSDLSLSWPRSLIKTTIPFNQYGHFSQVEPFKKSHFLIVKGK
jgi:hypothetical protein